MTNFQNSRKQNFLASIPTASLESADDTLTARCKFNFSYYCVQPAGQSFDDWNEGQIRQLLGKLANYSKESLRFWQTQPVGKSGTVLAIYGDFPPRSDFIHPSHVPHEVRWGRFRLDHTMRLVGFVVPDHLHGTPHCETKILFDSNTFYVVLLDGDHRFWKGKEAK